VIIMKDTVKTFLKEAELEQIESCVREAERTTRGEIVVMVAPGSHHYPMADLRGAAVFSIPAAIVLARTVGPLVWAGPHDLWVFLGFFLPLFFLCRSAVMSLPRLKRLFVSEKEMDHEVREAATIQFFLKGLFRTREETGVLIYLSVFEGKVWVLGDRGVDAAVPPRFWRGVVDEVVAGVKESRPAAAICAAVGRIRGVLQDKFPAAASDTNELPNLIVDA
jgi:putative membrane protein